MAGNDEAVACVFAYEGTFFRLMSYQYSEDLATVNMNMQIEFNVKDSEFTREATVRDVACMVGLGFLTSSMVGVLPVFSTKIVDMAPDGATPAAYASLTYFESYLPADKQRKFRKLMTYAFAKQLIMHRPTRLKSNRKRVHDLMDNAQSVIQAAVFTKLKARVNDPQFKEALLAKNWQECLKCFGEDYVNKKPPVQQIGTNFDNSSN